MVLKLIVATCLVCGLTTTVAFAQSSTQPPAATAPSMVQEVDIQTLPEQELRDKPVFDEKNEKVATVKDVTGSPGAPRQATLQTGGLLGVGGSEVRLPLDKLRVAPDGRLTLTMSESQMKLLPRAD